MALGATHHRWRGDVRAFVDELESRVPGVRCNTYVNHPFPGWDDRSVDVWWRRGRGDPLPPDIARRSLRAMHRIRPKPPIRHWILEHQWFTDWAGMLVWSSNDHSGRERHLHITFH